MIKNKKLLTLLVTILSLCLNVIPAFAIAYSTPRYLQMSDVNSAMYDGAIQASSGKTIASITVGWNKMQDGDRADAEFYDSSKGNTWGEILITTANGQGSGDLVCPSGYAPTQVTMVLGTGSLAGSRVMWYKSINYTDGTQDTFPEPDSSITGISTTTPDYTNQLNNISSQITELQNLINQLTSQLNDLKTKLDSVNNQLNSILNNANTLNNMVGSTSDPNSVIGQLNTSNGQLANLNTGQNTMIGQLGNIGTVLNNLGNYIQTPVASQPLGTGVLNPVPTFDGTPPQITVSSPQGSSGGSSPYVYDRSIPQMPTFVDSPSPLPQAPDPSSMPHDNPIQQETASQPNSALTPQSALSPSSALSPQSPISPQAPSIQAPLTPDPVSTDSPYSRQAPVGQSGYTRQDPIASSGYAMQAPITPQAPLTP